MGLGVVEDLSMGCLGLWSGRNLGYNCVCGVDGVGVYGVAHLIVVEPRMVEVQRKWDSRTPNS